MTQITKPVVLCFSGHDPSGGAGIQADIETITSHQCHAANVITALTEQNTSNVKEMLPQSPEAIISQAQTILEDLPVKAIKIGLIGHEQIAKAISTILSENPTIPVVLDPILAAGGGASLSSNALIQSIIELLLPRTTILTPNSLEARQLTKSNDLQSSGIKLLELGCEYVLITGSHEQSTVVSNQLFHKRAVIETYNWDRLPHSYHGSGCTLASSIAALMAHDLKVETCVQEAQEYTWNSLHAAYQPGKGQHIPNRLFWMQEHV
ncbi:hydroxymethylpyrimidine/phosphomethylpyrimidine kinase [Bathymodiolus japonicus methanotrophic gill symbiont]|uniref:bifunctional hydroxymethylpyrimidine kinase/phosphomethylpyrimidine kinase n=1 Tax=Bathymodiolus japonicus methanotrophic gill symbiont TaxID=113269 RepID=UPI001B5D8410|nr:hydroxymethylpyrimidine/phosphomethylpyrimidine kinase [Bathymodiolus japonicus methanotrophic gill symbiont]GFO72332.1 hydroxymethylpyrimidine/phosphomethylpyrimidine kinase [Bathymodiolus japonicus methanotrophic gill symbiont]